MSDLTVKKATDFLTEKGYRVLKPAQKDSIEKARVMYKSYQKHLGNMSSVAKEFGISRERVRQILGKHYDLKGTGERDNTDRIKEIKECFIKNNNDVIKTAQELNLTAWYVTTVRKQYFPELIPNKEPSKTRLDDDKLRELYHQFDGNIRQMAQHLGKHPGSLYDRLIRLGLKGCGNYKVSDSDIIRLFKKHKGNKSKASADAGITPSAFHHRIKMLKMSGKLE